MTSEEYIDKLKTTQAFAKLSKLKKRKLMSFEKDGVYDFGNEILYKLCEQYPKHKSEAQIIAKTLFIGRVYAAALERTSKKKSPKEKRIDFYRLKVVPKIRALNLDKEFLPLRKFSTLSSSNISKVIWLHKFLLEGTKRLSNNKKHSFCSKYLHFHFRELFFLFDTRALRALMDLGIQARDAPEEYKVSVSKLKTSQFDKSYKTYVLRCIAAREIINLITGKTMLSPRHLDNILLHCFKNRRKKVN